MPQRRILIVEDDLELCEMVLLQAKRRGFNCFTDNVGANCLATARLTDPDLVLMDLNLPRISGLGLIREFKKDPVLSQVPIIVFSANNDNLVVYEALDLGANAFYVKTSPLDELFETIRQYILTKPDLTSRMNGNTESISENHLQP